MLNLADRQGVAMLRLEHGKANALDVELLEALKVALEGLPQTARALVLTGSERMFSAGIDLPTLLARDADYALRLIAALDDVLEAFQRLAVPSVAAINGHAIAGGFVLACACDVRLMARGAGKLGLTEIRVGVPFPPLALETVRTAIGERLTRRLVLQGDLYEAAEAMALGLVDALVEPPLLLEQAQDWARRLGSVPSTAFLLSKRQLALPGQMRMRALDDDHERLAGEAWTGEGTRRLIEEFVRRRLG